MSSKELSKMLEQLPEANKEQLALVAQGILIAQMAANETGQSA